MNAAGISGWSPLGFCILPAAEPDQPSGLALDPTGPSTSPVNEVCVGGVSMTTARLVWVAPLDNGCAIRGEAPAFSQIDVIYFHLNVSFCL